MSHFTVLVFLRNDQKLRDLLAPYDENKEVSPYIATPRDEFIADKRKWYSREKGDDEENDEPDYSVMSDEDFLKAMAEKGYDLDEQGNETSTYNSNVFAYIVCPGVTFKTNPDINGIGNYYGPGNKVDISTRNEILSDMQTASSFEQLSQLQEKSRQALLLLQGMYEKEELESNSGTPEKMALDGEIQYNCERVRQNVPGAEGSMCNLRKNTGQQISCSGSRSSDRESSRAFVQQLQHDIRNGGGQIRLARCNEVVPHGPHVLEKIQIRGAQWDWWTIGGRWHNSLRLKEPDEDGNDRCNYALVKDLNFDPDPEVYKKKERFWELYIEGAEPANAEEKEMLSWTMYKKEYFIERFGTKENYATLESQFETWAVVTPDGEWHEKGNMGWWGMSAETHEEAVQWVNAYKEKFIDTADPEWIAVVVDCHI